MILPLRFRVAVAAIAAACAITVAPGCTSPTVTPSALSQLSTSRSRANPVLVAYWESWDDTNPTSEFGPLASVPSSVDIAEIADFEVNNGSAAYQGPFNAHSLEPGAARLHARGGKVFLSIGGYSSKWGVESIDGFIKAVAAVISANPGVFDGFDFDDENIPYQDVTPQAGQHEVEALVRAVHGRWPNMQLSYTAFVMGADRPLKWSDDQGEDVAILHDIGKIVNFVNVMEYTQYLGRGKVWFPARYPGCRWQPGFVRDCYLDTLEEFAGLKLAGGGRLGRGKVVMGLEVRPEQPKPAALTPQQMETYAAWLRLNGYRGASIWSIDRDYPSVSGYARGTFAAAIHRGLY
jgi:Glycosyl hydrolases family 18